MYLLLIPSHLWWAFYDLESAKDFLSKEYHKENAKILKCTGPQQWEEINIKGE